MRISWPEVQSAVFLRRSRAALALFLLIYAMGASARFLYLHTIPKEALDAPDGMSVVDSRYAQLRPALPQGQVVCFLPEAGVSEQGAIDERYSAQYGLAPVLLTPGSTCEWFLRLTSGGACVGNRNGERCRPF